MHAVPEQRRMRHCKRERRGAGACARVLAHGRVNQSACLPIRQRLPKHRTEPSDWLRAGICGSALFGLRPQALFHVRKRMLAVQPRRRVVAHDHHGYSSRGVRCASRWCMHQNTTCSKGFALVQSRQDQGHESRTSVPGTLKGGETCIFFIIQCYNISLLRRFRLSASSKLSLREPVMAEHTRSPQKLLRVSSPYQTSIFCPSCLCRVRSRAQRSTRNLYYEPHFSLSAQWYCYGSTRSVRNPPIGARLG